MRKKNIFVCFAEKAATWSGHPCTFLLACAIVFIWAVSGPFFGFSETWQLVINTGTTIITFLLVFLIQNSQNRDTRALQLKLDELIRATQGAHTVLLDLEELEEAELDKIRQKYLDIASNAREAMKQGGKDTDIPEIMFEDEERAKK